MKAILAGAGAFGIKHLDGIKNIDDVEVVGLVGRILEPTHEVAQKYGIEHAFTDLADALALTYALPVYPNRAGYDGQQYSHQSTDYDPYEGM